ncbi:hypothetical protein CDAR_236961 [Caerostris darwini]|uniref:C2H2-type domain-containing protein n=1 Tax=Caerostris darwini TaxID=1538125 RepID=A0AAV4W3A3_9ARAC|nr:hypothetical protein CDAR_236961 [Caerostris darwini]
MRYLLTISADQRLQIQVVREFQRDFQDHETNLQETAVVPRFPSESTIQANSEAQKCFFKFTSKNCNFVLDDKNFQLYFCQICRAKYKQKYSQKRHFLSSHVNPIYIYISDLWNCRIAVSNREILEDLYKVRKSSERRRFGTDSVTSKCQGG